MNCQYGIPINGLRSKQPHKMINIDKVPLTSYSIAF